MIPSQKHVILFCYQEMSPKDAGSFTERQLFILKLLYFVLNAMLYSTYTFTAKYFDDVWRIPAHHFGYIIGLCALSFSGSIFWTMLADRTGRHKLIILLATTGYVGWFFALRLDFLKSASDIIRALFVGVCYGISSFCTSALFPLLDSRILLMLSTDAHLSKELFGRQRLFGVFGQSFVTILNGIMIDYLGFDAIFLNLLLFSTIFIILVISAIPDFHCNSIVVSPKDEHEPSLSFGSAIGRLVLSFDYVFFLVIILLAGTTRGVTGNYLVQYLEKSMKLNSMVSTIMMQTRIIAEIGIFFAGGQLMGIFGVHRMLLIAQVSGFIRVFVYAVIPTRWPWTLTPLIIELLKGVNNACLVSAGVRYVHDFAPVGVEATAQGFFSGVHSYLANAASGFFSGFVLQIYENDAFAFQKLFAYTSVLSAIGISTFCIKQLLATCK